ncbi:hypothetical protein [Sinorhizobium psoraleae]|uniref:Secreted protein n=1 Tax=Sinorhizobium psoraleae TaxID=520838 RepID=A0ABT4KI73_9HYPH|nr:hypothetical protein [Sinorhizobium psoraleae]MCZ4091670.1 hypothetical protein [Sinorhizobium psoraleae]
MTQISRRVILGGIAATAGGVFATAIPLPAPAAVDEQPAMTPEERLQAAIEELKAAAAAIAPDIRSWQCLWDPDRAQSKLIIVAYDF